MKIHNHTKTTRSLAFTLVELLVVIGIIALLISILLPSLNKARKAANTISCASNMRQIGLAMVQYANDNQGFLPYASMDVGPSPNNNGNAITWDDLLNSYVGRHDDQFMTGGVTYLQNQWNPNPIPVFTCPEDQFDRSAGGYQKRSFSIVQVSFTGSGAGSAASYSGTVYGMATRTLNYTTGWTPNPNFRCFRNTDAPRSSETLLLVECPLFLSGGQYLGNRLGSTGGCQVDSPRGQSVNGYLQPLHAGRWNYLFVDGHVELLTPQETLHTPATINDTTCPNYMWTRNPND